LVGYIVSILLIVVLFNPPLVISGVSPKLGFPFWLDAGPFYFLLIIHYLVYAIIDISMLFKFYLHMDGILRRQAFYILIAAVVGFTGGSTNFLPATLGIYPFGNFFVFLFPVFIFYGIFVDEIKFKLVR